jgi:hypothetical protein
MAFRGMNKNIAPRKFALERPKTKKKGGVAALTAPDTLTSE